MLSSSGQTAWDCRSRTITSQCTEERFARVAQAQGLSESALLRRLVESSLLATAAADTRTTFPVEPVATTGQISVRLRHDDLVFLRERVRARELPMSTYESR
jgi:hypothetical protein